MNEDTKLADMQHQLDEVLAMHARILSSPPVHVEAAYATILRIGANLAREGRLAGKDLADAVEKIKRYVKQEQGANDTLTASVEELEDRLTNYCDGCHR